MMETDTLGIWKYEALLSACAEISGSRMTVLTKSNAESVGLHNLLQYVMQSYARLHGVWLRVVDTKKVRRRWDGGGTSIFVLALKPEILGMGVFGYLSPNSALRFVYSKRFAQDLVKLEKLTRLSKILSFKARRLKFQILTRFGELS